MRRERFEGGGEEEFAATLYAPEMHDPDLLIRTSGEQRLSNYLLWQCAYSELVFRDCLWPDSIGPSSRPPWSSTRRAGGASGRGNESELGLTAARRSSLPGVRPRPRRGIYGILAERD